MSCVLVTLVPGVTASGWRCLSGESTGLDCVTGFVGGTPLSTGGRWFPSLRWSPIRVSDSTHGLSCRRTDDSAAWVPHPEKSAARKRKQIHLIQVKTQAARKARRWSDRDPRTPPGNPVLPAFHFSCASTARVRFPGPSAPHTCTWAAPPPSGVLPKTRLTSRSGGSWVFHLSAVHS